MINLKNVIVVVLTNNLIHPKSYRIRYFETFTSAGAIEKDKTMALLHLGLIA